MSTLRLFHKLRLELHRTYAVDFAIDVVIAFYQANVLHLGTHLHHRGGAFELEVFNQRHAIAIRQGIAVGIAHQQRIFSNRSLLGLPLVAALRAQQMVAIGVGVGRLALGARRQNGICHGQRL